MANATDIQNLYIAYFNRPADVAGLTYWTSGAQADFTAVQIAQSFSKQPEYANAFANVETTQVVGVLYRNLFNHEADYAGMNYWARQINNGTFTIGQVAIAILAGATGEDAATVAAKFSAASSFTSKMATNPSAQAAYNPGNSNNAYGIAKFWLGGVIDAGTSASATATLDTTFAAMTKVPVVVVPSVTLAVNPGTANLGTAGNDAFTATDAALLLAGTSINGNGGTDVLNLTTPITGVDHLATITGVPTLNLQKVGSMLGIGSPFLNQFTTINDYGTGEIDQLSLGTVAQTLNLYNTSGGRWVALKAPNQVINQVAIGSGGVNIYATNANLVGATFNLINGSGSSTLNIFDAGTATLSSAQMSNISMIVLLNTETLTFSPNVDISVISQGTSVNLTSLSPRHINVSQNYSAVMDVHLAGIGNYIVDPGLAGTITNTGTAGTLTVLGMPGSQTITSSVVTSIDTAYSGKDNAADTLNGTGSFTVTNLGQYANNMILDGGTLTGALTVNTTGTNAVAVIETTGTGVVTAKVGGTGVLTMSTTTSHATTIYAVSGVNAKLALAGTGNITVNGAASGNLSITGSAALETINLSATGGGVDNVSVSGSTLGNITSKLITINNFKVSGADVLHFGNAASSLGVINIASSDLASLMTNIGTGAGTLANNDYKAFMVNVASGAAAGSYIVEHTAGTTVGANDVIVKLTGNTGTIVAGDLQA